MCVASKDQREVMETNISIYEGMYKKSKKKKKKKKKKIAT